MTIIRLRGYQVIHSFVSCLVHVVFSTKDRRPLISPALQERLWPYIGGIGKSNKMRALQVGGVEDHVHILLSIPSTMSIAKAVQLIKGSSSKWVHDTFPELSSFEWQEGYGAFSIGISGVGDTTRYIKNQADHHRKKSFKTELKAILKKHAIAFEDWMLD